MTAKSKFGCKQRAERLLALVFFVALTALPAQAQRSLGSLRFQPCTLASDFGAQSLEAQCTTLSVPENRGVASGRKISLTIAWLPAKNEAVADPVFLLAGGPGQSARQAFPGIAAAFDEVRKRRHIVLVDQRGTGASNPLVCQAAQGEKSALAAQNDPPAAAAALAARCAAELSPRADLRFYGTHDAVADLDAVRRAIGAAQLNLVGVSYGTRVAQRYAARYPRHTRTLTLDGVVPNTLVLGNEQAKNLERSLDRQFALCRQDKACAALLGDPRQHLNILLKRLAQSPPPVHYRDAITGQAQTETLTRDHLALLARMFAYAPAIASLLPLQLSEAAQGRYEPLMALATLLDATLGEQIALGLQLSVICSEDADELRADPADAQSVLGNETIAALQAQCAVWPRGVRPPDFRQPLRSQVPALLLSGEFDPVTPSRYGEAVQRGLPNSRHLIIRGQGHNVLPVGCLPKLFARFIDRADANSLDARCLQKVPYTQPFTGFYGWGP